MKAKRQAKILELITSHTVTTQEELQTLLEEAGYAATQATISRDIKELRLIKALSSSGSYYYTLVPVQERETAPVNLNSVFLESVRQVDFAGNTVVVKCHTGMANAVCATIDNGSWNGLVGTIAGDDTIFLLMRTEAQAQEFAQYLRELAERAGSVLA